MTKPDHPFRWGHVIPVALLPAALFAVGEGAIIPVLPAIAGDVGATLAVAGFVGAMLMVGELLGDIPSGTVISRIGERRAMIGAAALAVVGTSIALVAPNPWVLGIGILILGIATAVFALARHALVTTIVPISHRARGLSTLAGTFRFGYLAGPFLGAAVISLTGSVESVFVVQIVCCAAVVAVLFIFHDPERAATVHAARMAPLTGETAVGAEVGGLFRTIVTRRHVLLTLGMGSLILAALRASRQLVLPLWAVNIGLDETTTSIIIGIAGAIDFSLFFAGGWLMDRFGRLWTAVPATLGLAVGHLVLAFSHDLPGPTIWFVAVAMFLALTNGVGAGILMTLGADLADRRNPAPFLGAWRFTNDSGGALAPLIVAGLTALVSLPFAVGTLGVIGVGGALILRFFIPKHVPKLPPRGSRGESSR
ncbi:MAG TPA: MFS transporter [Pseudolysinimonas sp.]|nr:MFS transporter [Pseudolysinimonas sp.]